MRATVVTVPTTRPCAWALGSCRGFTRTILEIQCADGLIGLGECEGAAVARILEGGLGARLVGLSWYDLPQVAVWCHIGLHDFGCLSDTNMSKAYAAIEMAMLDLQGKACGRPVCDLLGGAMRPSAEYVAYLYSVDLDSSGLAESNVPAAMAISAREALERSQARLLEFKIGRHSLSTDIETIRAVREAVGPGVELAIDANQNLDLVHARRLLKAVEPERLSWFEEPTGRLVEMARLAAEFDVAVSTHCTTVDTMRSYPGIEGVVGDLHLQGGMRGMLRSAAVFHALGHQFWQRSSLELGISWAAMTHAIIAAPDRSRASQCLIDYVEDDLVEGPPWELKQGAVVAPTAPGLGVTLDRDALARYAESYVRQGEATHFDG